MLPRTWISTIVLTLLCISAQAQSSLLSLERMGAGAPGGWKVDGNGYSWTAETTPGPLGAGAARIEFADQGELKLLSPARAMRTGEPHTLALWLRSEPSGAKVAVEIRDNDNEGNVSLKETFTATSEWHLYQAQSTLPKAFKGRYYLKLEVNAADTTVWLDGLWLGEANTSRDEKWCPAIHPAGVVLEPEVAWGVVTGNAPLRVKARVVSSATAGTWLKLHAVNTLGMAMDLPSIPLDSTRIWSGSFEVNGEAAQPYGMVRIEATVVDADDQPLSPMTETLLARVPEPIPGPMPESYFGVHVSPREPDAAVVAKLGYKWCRMHDASGITKWGHIEPEPGQWLWHDEEVALLRSHGLSIVGLLDSAPTWETGADPNSGYFSIWHAPKDIQHWRNYVRQVVSHYTGAIDEWEVWNEPWDMQRFFQGGTPEIYSQLLKAAYEEAKAANPESVIIGIDTYPEMWDKAVLAYGAYPYYDRLSWHRYDPTLQGRPGDGISRATERLRQAQEPYGKPKPILSTEGGPDVTVFQGSFFSFADPVIMGNWSEGTDRYARFFLSMITAGNRRFIAYSLHNDTYHGWLTHMMSEPGYLMRPMQAGLAALAHFIDGASYENRLTPTPDLSAQVFNHPQATPGVKANSTVLVLYADGADPENLPHTLPAGIECFDRWANPIEPPLQVGRSLIFLVAGPEVREGLLTSLQPDLTPLPPSPKERGGNSLSPLVGEQPTVEMLLGQAVETLTSGKSDLWSLFSSQGSFMVMGGATETIIAKRAGLRTQPALAAKFHLPPGTTLGESVITPAGRFTMGSFSLTHQTHNWSAAFVAVPDGSEGNWRFTSLSILSDNGTAEATATQIKGVLKEWETAVAKASLDNLPDTLATGPCCLMAATMNDGYFVFDNPIHLLAMMNTVVVFGPAPVSSMDFSKIVTSGTTATVTGSWRIGGLAFGMAPYAFTATLIQQNGEWRIATLCVSAEQIP